MADSVNNLQPHRNETISNNEQFLAKEDSLLRIKTSTTSSGDERPYLNSTATIATSNAAISQRRPGDPRLVNNFPVSSNTSPAVSSGGGWPVVSSDVHAPATGQQVLQFSQHGDSSGTPGKKKVRDVCLTVKHNALLPLVWL